MSVDQLAARADVDQDDTDDALHGWTALRESAREEAADLAAPAASDDDADGS